MFIKRRVFTEEIIEFLKSRDIDKIHLEPNTLDESLLLKAGIDFTHEPDPEIRVGVTKPICGWQIPGPFCKRMEREVHCMRRCYRRSISLC
jgi:hypothetical protein